MYRYDVFFFALQYPSMPIYLRNMHEGTKNKYDF